MRRTNRPANSANQPPPTGPQRSAGLLSRRLAERSALPPEVLNAEAATRIGRFSWLLSAPFLLFALMRIFSAPALAWFVLAAFSGAWFIASLSAIRLARPMFDAPYGRPTLAVWVVLVSIAANAIVLPVVFSSIGFLVALTLMALIMIITAISQRVAAISPATDGPLNQRQILAAYTLGLFVALLVILLDGLSFPNRLLLLSDNLNLLISIIMGATFFGLFAWRFRTLPLRAKLVAAFILITGVSVTAVAVVSVLNTSQSLTATANQNLSTASIQSVSSVDAFILTTRESIHSEARLPLFSQYLSLPENERSVELSSQVAELMRTLREKGSRSQGLYRLTYIQAYMLLDKTGAVIFDTTQASLGENLSAQPFFNEALSSPDPYLSPLLFTETGQPILYFAARVQDNAGSPIGLLLVRYNAIVLQQIISENKDLSGVGSYPILLDDNNLRLAQGRSTDLLYRFYSPLNIGLTRALEEINRLPKNPDLADLTTDQPNLTAVLDRLPDPDPANGGLQLFEYFDAFSPVASPERYLAAVRPLGSAEWRIIYTQSESFFLGPIAEQIRNTQLLAILIIALSIAAAAVLSQALTAPIISLTEVATAVTGGNLSARAATDTEDEVGALALAFNDMTSRLQTTLTGLEQRIEDRTRDLERRSVQLQAAAEVGRTAANIRNPDELLNRVTILISERFGFYHVGVFLLDETGKYAVLRAANSEGGRHMLARSHRLGVGQQGIVGYVTGAGRPRIALDVGDDATFFNNPDLPSTRSEMALPLISGGQMIGALDVQSTQPSAFSPADVAVLQVLADLIAVAIENARLFTDSQSAIETTRRAYGELSRQAWIDRLHNRPGIGYRSLERGGVYFDPETAAAQPLQLQEPGATSHLLRLPIRVRDLTIGHLDTHKPVTQGPWTADERQTVGKIVDQLAIALEGARLYENSQLQAERERLISDITGRMRQSLDIEEVTRSAAADIRAALALQEVIILLGEAADAIPDTADTLQAAETRSEESSQ